MSEPFLTGNNNRYFHVPFPQPLCSPNYSVTNLTQTEILKFIVVTGQNVVCYTAVFSVVTQCSFRCVT